MVNKFQNGNVALILLKTVMSKLVKIVLNARLVIGDFMTHQTMILALNVTLLDVMNAKLLRKESGTFQVVSNVTMKKNFI